SFGYHASWLRAIFLSPRSTYVNDLNNLCKKVDGNYVRKEGNSLSGRKRCIRANNNRSLLKYWIMVPINREHVGTRVSLNKHDLLQIGALLERELVVRAESKAPLRDSGWVFYCHCKSKHGDILG